MAQLKELERAHYAQFPADSTYRDPFDPTLHGLRLLAKEDPARWGGPLEYYWNSFYGSGAALGDGATNAAAPVRPVRPGAGSPVRGSTVTQGRNTVSGGGGIPSTVDELVGA